MIFVYNGYESNDYTANGLGPVFPTKCIVTEEAGGSCEAELSHPLDNDGLWKNLENGNILRVPCPSISVSGAITGDNLQVWKTTEAADVYSQPDAPVRLTYQQWVSGTNYAVGSKVTRSGQNWQSTLHMDDPAERDLPPAENTGNWKRIMNWTAGSSVLTHLNTNTEVYVLSEYSSTWLRVQTASGIEGYLQKSKAAYVRTEQRTPVEPRVVRDQLFRIYKTEINTNGTAISVYAEHVSYDLSHILLGECNITGMTASGALSRIRAAMMEDAQCTISTDIPDSAGKFTGDFSYQNPIYAILDPESGVVPYFGAKVVRDNWDLFILKNDATDRGFRITYGVNLKGVTWKRDTQKVVTRLVPIAKDEDDTDLLLTEKWVDSDFITAYPTPVAQTLKVDGKVGGDDGEGGTWTRADLLQHMRDVCEDEFAGGCDLPQEEITIDFQNLGDTEEYRQFKDLVKLYLYDTVQASHPDIGLNRKLQVNATKWDAVNGKFTEITLGSSLEYQGLTLAGYQIQGGTVTSRNLARSSVTQDQLANAAVTYMKIGSAAIAALKADSVDAVTVFCQHLVAEQITTDDLYVALATIATAQITTAHIQSASIDWAQITDLTAEVADIAQANITTANIKNANIDWAQIATLTTDIVNVIGTANINYAKITGANADQLIVKDGEADRYFIRKLQVDNLQVINQTVNNLVVKASNGNYYRLDVGNNGAVTSTQVTVTSGEIAAGVTNTGRSIIETDLTVSDLAASNIKGANALIDKLTAARISVDELFARDATIGKLQTTDISSNTSLQTYVADRLDFTVGKLPFVNPNILLAADTDVATTGYPTIRYDPYVDAVTGQEAALVVGEQYTFTVRLQTQSAASGNVMLYTSGGYVSLVSIPLYSEGTAWSTYRGTFTFNGYGTQRPDDHQLRVYCTPQGRPVRIQWAKLEKGDHATDFCLSPAEMKNSGISIKPDSLNIYSSGTMNIASDGKMVIESGAEGRINLNDGSISTKNLNAQELTVGGKQVGVNAFMLSLPAVFTQGASSAPAGHGFLWLNASGSSYSSAQTRGATSDGYLPRTFTLDAPENTLSAGTFTYTCTCAITNRQGSNPATITPNITIKITNKSSGANVSFAFDQVTVRKWESKNLTKTVTTTVNLFGANAQFDAQCTFTRSGGTTGTPDMDSGVDIVLTATKQNAGGAQSVTVQYVP